MPENDDFNTAAPENEVRPLRPINHARWIIATFFISAFLVGGLFYRLIVAKGFGRTSLMFIGIPAVLAIILVLSPAPKTVTGSVLRGITLALLFVAPLLGEGYLCILFASPLFLGIGLVIGMAVDFFRSRRSATLSCIALLLLPASLEGVVPWLTYNRSLSAEAGTIVSASASEVEDTLSKSPDTSTELPHFLSIGFPRPLAAYGSGLAAGDLRTIHFAGAEGDPPGDLVMRIAESRPGYVRFETVSDGSKLTQWLRWRSSEVTYRPIDSSHTVVTWRISFDRELDPYWYFAPWERFAVGQAARFLIAANAAPRR